MTAWTTHDWSAAKVDYSLDALKASMRKLDWFNYEVDPAWRGFCEFGPDDIGGVWEKLGVIRKRDPVKMAVVTRDVAAAMNKRVENHILYGAPLHGLPVYVDPLLPNGTALLSRHWLGSWGDT